MFSSPFSFLISPSFCLQDLQYSTVSRNVMGRTFRTRVLRLCSCAPYPDRQPRRPHRHITHSSSSRDREPDSPKPKAHKTISHATFMSHVVTPIGTHLRINRAAAKHRWRAPHSLTRLSERPNSYNRFLALTRCDALHTTPPYRTQVRPDDGLHAKALLSHETVPNTSSLQLSCRGSL